MAEGPSIQIDEVTYLKRVVSRLTARAEMAEQASDKYAALCDMLSEELNRIKEGEGHE